jgi:hypothetical protein
LDYAVTVSVPILSIVIPSHNGAARVPILLDELNLCIPENMKQTVQVVVSDNFSNPDIVIESKYDFALKLVKTESFLATAEENLSYGIKHSDGVFCWVLGDNDIPIKNGVQHLLNQLQNTEFDICIYNSLAKNNHAEVWDITRVQMEQIVNPMPITDFVKRMGFWSVTAGFSTLVFRRNLFNVSYFDRLHRENLKIYSHVFAMLFSFHDKNFCAMNIPLVKYSSNSFDNESVLNSDRDLHWINFATNHQHFYRNPWTLAFLKQIDTLEEAGIFRKFELLDVIDQGHLGNRFYIFDAILSFVVDQLLVEEESILPQKITPAEMNYVLESLYGIDTQFDEIIESIRASHFPDKSMIILQSIRNSLISESEQFARRYMFSLAGGKVYRSPYGFLWAPFPTSLNKSQKSLTKPYGVLVSETLEALEVEVAKFKNSNFNYQDVNLPMNINLGGLNANIIRVDKLLKRVPRILKRIIK